MTHQEIYEGLTEMNRFMVFNRHNKYWKAAINLYKIDNPKSCSCECSSCREKIWNFILSKV